MLLKVSFGSGVNVSRLVPESRLGDGKAARIQYSEKRSINVRGINKHIKTKAIKLKVLYFVAFIPKRKK